MIKKYYPDSYRDNSKGIFKRLQTFFIKVNIQYYLGGKTVCMLKKGVN